MIWLKHYWSGLLLNCQDKTKEVISICNAFCDNDYQDWLLNKSDHISREKYNDVDLPYFKSSTNEVSRTLRKFNIGVYTYPYRTIGNILPKLKDSVDASISTVQFIKFLVKIVLVYTLVKREGAFNTCLFEHKRDLKSINLAKLKEDDLNKKLHWLNIILNMNLGSIL